LQEYNGKSATQQPSDGFRPTRLRISPALAAAVLVGFLLGPHVAEQDKLPDGGGAVSRR